MLTVTPHALIDATTFKARMKRSTTAESDVDQRCIDAINAATHWMEDLTRRKLRARNYRTANTLSCTGLSGVASLSVASTSTLHVGDEMVGALGIDTGTQIASITSASVFVPSVAPNSDWGSPGTRNVTFGSRPITIDVERDAAARSLYSSGQRDLWLPERPLVEVYAIYWADLDGNRTALNLTGARYDYDIGRIRLTNDVFPAGALNVQVEARVGYVKPTGADRGHDEWYALEALALRVAEIAFTDALQIRGRADSIGTAGASAQLSSVMPRDVLDGLQRYVRRW